MSEPIEQSQYFAYDDRVRKRGNSGGGRLRQNAYLTLVLFHEKSPLVGNMSRLAVASSRGFLSNAGVEVFSSPEAGRRDYWYRKFTGSIGTSWDEYGLTETQKPVIKGLVSAIVSHTSTPGEVIDPIIKDKDISTPEDGVNLWLGLDHLMRATERLTGERHRYTPYELIASLRSFSTDCVRDCLDVDSNRKAAQVQSLELGLPPGKRERLKGIIDHIVEDPNLMEVQTRDSGCTYSVHPNRPDRTSYYWRKDWREFEEKHISEQRAFLTDPIRTDLDRMRINGEMRSFETCWFQSDYILDQLPSLMPDLGFSSGRCFYYALYVRRTTWHHSGSPR
jgi:hypothetical protein